MAVEESEGDEIDAQTAGRDLRTLVNRGLLEPRGETRGRSYLGSDTLRAHRASVVAQRPRAGKADLFKDEDQQLRLGLVD